jgi:uncharacterized protein (DUF2147 family)
MKRQLLAAAGSLLWSLSLPAKADPPPSVEVGLWQTYSDKTGQPNGTVRIYLQDGKLGGVVESLRPGAPADTKCTKCPGTLKDKPILGIVVMWGMRKDGDSWSGGSILDPESGDIYRCTVKYEAPDKLNVRGFIGIPLFGRTQTWKRLSIPNASTP